jgi:hypothetical protein
VVSLRFLILIWLVGSDVGMDEFGMSKGNSCFLLFFMVSLFPFLLTKCLLGILCLS